MTTLANTTTEPASVEQGTGRIFSLTDFQQYAPRNALDMLEQVPGFSVRDDDQDRGLGQANSNVLIDGE